ncbi:hypothetical protein GCM10011609_07860 [Lentzea pudingi]|uniref:Uncharacterized protein n=1 Tax=Lentzea pudingi TaxID=1789439 RepID=A0ABQ2HCX9_9PSEU|nr:hypothetical protein GCM10011609_07860 [Lentzea pudingi]
MLTALASRTTAALGSGESAAAIRQRSRALVTAARRPFIYVPLRHHFEQNFHVRHRLERYGAGRCMTYEEVSDRDVLAEEIGREVSYRRVETDGASRAAALLAELL